MTEDDPTTETDSSEPELVDGAEGLPDDVKDGTIDDDAKE